MSQIQIQINPLTLSVNAADGKKRVDILLVPDGKTKSTNGNFSIDASTAKSIITEFKRRRILMVIDWEHQTLGGRYARADGRAPAAGWIHALRYEPGKGIIGEVEWTESARDAIKSGEYRYLSPVVMVRKADHKAVRLQSAAVTNDPAIHGMERLAASRRFGMAKKLRVRPRGRPRKNTMDLLGDPFRLVLQEATPEEEAAVVEEVVEEIDEVGAAIADLKAALGMGEDAGPVDVIRAAIEKMGDGGEDEEADEAAEKEMKALCDVLSLKSTSTVEDMIAKVNKMQATTVSGAEYKALTAKLEALEQTNCERDAESLVEEYVDAGKLNPHDESRMEWALKQATKDAEAFTELMEGAPKLFEPGRAIDPKKGASGGKTERQNMIAEELKTYKANENQFEGIDVVHVINAGLDNRDEPQLTSDEREALKVGGKV